MKTKKRLIPALVFSALAAVASVPAQAAQFSNVIVFGDSLSDAGFYRPTLLASGVPASLVSVLGRFTINPGPVWSELVSVHYGVANPGPSNAGGSIYAQGGARVQLPSASEPPNLQRQVSDQIGEYLATGSGKADPNALYAVFAGGNDMLQNIGLFTAGAISSAQFQTNVLAAATAEVGQVGRLSAAGARYILVFGLPDVGGTPAVQAAGAATAASITQLSAGFNTTLFTTLAGAGLRVIPVDIFGLFADVKTNATAFGFTNTTGVACLPFPPFSTSPNSQFCTAANIQPGGQSYFFADSVHPTPAAQAILAGYVESLIDGPSQYSLMPETELRVRSAHVRTLATGAQYGIGQPVGKITAFVAADGAKFDTEATQGNASQTTNNSAFTIGVLGRISENVTVGAAFGSSNSKAVVDGGTGGYRVRELAYSIFASARGENLYAQVAGTVGDDNYDSIHRDIVLGSVRRGMDAGTRGNNASIFGTLGYDFNFGRLRVGPLVSIASQDVTVNAFDETPANGAPITGALSIGTQTRKSEVWSVGGRASYSFGDWTPWIRITADKERKDDDRFVTATVRSLSSIGMSYDILAYAPDTSFVTAYVGLNGRVSDWIGLSVMYYRVSGRSGIKEDGLSGSVSIRF